MWSRRCWVSLASVILGWKSPVGILAEGCFHSGGRLRSLWTPPGGQQPSAHQVEEKQANTLSLFLLRNLHHVLSEDLHVCSWGAGEAGSGWVEPSWTEPQEDMDQRYCSRLLVMLTSSELRTRDLTGRRLVERATWLQLSFLHQFFFVYRFSCCLFHAATCFGMTSYFLEDHCLVFDAASNELKWPKTTLKV